MDFERGVYDKEIGDLRQLTAIGSDGRVLRQALIHKDVFSDRDVQMLWDWLDCVSPPTGHHGVTQSGAHVLHLA